MREQFLPELPDSALVVIAGRNPPGTGWRDDAGWRQLIEVVGLRNLDPEHARALLAERGIVGDVHDRLLAMTGGHPLALSLIADVVSQAGEVPEDIGEAQDVIDALLARFVADVPSRQHREALAVAAIVEATTEPLLRDVLPDSDAAVLFDWLKDLSFIERGPHGLYPHALARDVLEADLRWRDQERHRRLRRRAGRYLVDRVAATTGPEQDQLAREMRYLHRHNPLFRPYSSWADADAA